MFETGVTKSYKLPPAASNCKELIVATYVSGAVESGAIMHIPFKGVAFSCIVGRNSGSTVLSQYAILYCSCSEDNILYYSGFTVNNYNIYINYIFYR